MKKILKLDHFKLNKTYLQKKAYKNKYTLPLETSPPPSSSSSSNLWVYTDHFTFFTANSPSSKLCLVFCWNFFILSKKRTVIFTILLQFQTYFTSLSNSYFVGKMSIFYIFYSSSKLYELSFILWKKLIFFCLGFTPVPNFIFCRTLLFLSKNGKFSVLLVTIKSWLILRWRWYGDDVRTYLCVWLG